MTRSGYEMSTEEQPHDTAAWVSLYRAVLDAEQIGFLITDCQHIILDGNDRAFDLLDIDREESIGHRVSGVLPEFVGLEDEVRDLFLRQTEVIEIPDIVYYRSEAEADGSTSHPPHAMDATEADTVTDTVTDTDTNTELGKYFCTIRNYPHFNEHGEIVGSIVTIVDVTEQAQLKQQMMQQRNELELVNLQLQEANRAIIKLNNFKYEMLSRVSHEFLTPLNHILGYSELILDGVYGSVEGTMHEVIAKIDVKGRKLLRLIKDFIRLSKIVANNIDWQFEPIQLDALIDDVLLNYREKATRRDLELIVETDSDLPTIQSDPVKISEVLRKVLNNAFKFTEEGSIIVRAGAVTSLPEWAQRATIPRERTMDEEGSKKIIVVIEDSGIGMVASMIDSIVAPFVQADGSTTREFGGVGIGLTIACHYIRLLGGQFTIESSPGEGTAFQLLLPLTPPDRNEAKGAIKRATHDTGNGR